MRLVRRTTPIAVAMLIAVISLVATTTGSAQAHEELGTVPDVRVTLEETEAGVVLTVESKKDPEVTLTVTLEDGGVDLDVIEQDEDIEVEVIYTNEGVTMTATSADGTTIVQVIATPDSVMWRRYSLDYTGEAIYP